jgi:uncharacterized protein
MKKRLRKKLHKGEFQEFGFDFSIQFHQPLTPEKADDLLDDFIEMIEKNALFLGGGGEELSLQGFIVATKKSVTDEHEIAITDWIKSKKDLIQSYKLEKKDAWNGDY